MLDNKHEVNNVQKCNVLEAAGVSDLELLNYFVGHNKATVKNVIANVWINLGNLVFLHIFGSSHLRKLMAVEFCW